MANSVRETAARATRAGLVVIPPREDGTKAPEGNWGHWRETPPSVDQLRHWYGNGRSGVGIATDKARLLDFDDEHTYQVFRDTAEASGLADLVERIEAGYHELTPDAGHHWLFYCVAPIPTAKLARRPAPTEDEPHKVETLIEVKADGGYAVIAPSQGPVHPSGRPYRLITGGIETIVTITADEWRLLERLAAAFDEMPKPEHEPRERGASDDDTPGNDFISRTDWFDLLNSRGWQQVGSRGAIQYWRRPGKDRGISATVNGPGILPDRLYVFTSSTPLEPNRSYTRFQAYAYLVHGGDFSTAAKQLRADGYGGRSSVGSVRPIRVGTGAAPDDAAALPEIDAGNLILREVSELAWKAVMRANEPPFLFRYSGVPARVEQHEHEPPITRALTDDRLRHVLARVADWYKWAKTADGFARRDALPPVHVVRDMLAAPEQPLPALVSIIEAPAFAADGSLHERPGYHEPGRTFYAPTRGFVAPPVPTSPTAEDVTRARALIADELLGDFPFVDDAERAHAIALLLLPFVRGLIDGPTPLHLIEKPSPGTGASLLADVLTYPAIGRAAPAMTEGRDEDEWRKRITAKLTTGTGVVLIDNLRRRLDSASVASVITSTVWEDRILGKSENVLIPVRCAWVATGNNPALSSELTRRTIRIRLNAQTDRPWLRTSFHHPNLRAWASEHRGDLVWAALTLARGWIVAGRPEPECATLGMFEGWTRVIGGILAHAAIPGFLTNLSQFYDESDTEGAEIRVFLSAWWERKEAGQISVADLFPIATAPNSMLDLQSKTEQGQKVRLGRLLHALKDRHYQLDDNLSVCVRAAGSRNKSIIWRLDGFQINGGADNPHSINPQQQAIFEDTYGGYGGSAPITRVGRKSLSSIRKGEKPPLPPSPPYDEESEEDDDEPDF